MGQRVRSHTEKRDDAKQYGSFDYLDANHDGELDADEQQAPLRLAWITRVSPAATSSRMIALRFAETTGEPTGTADRDVASLQRQFDAVPADIGQGSDSEDISPALENFAPRLMDAGGALGDRSTSDRQAKLGTPRAGGAQTETASGRRGSETSVLAGL